MKRPFSRLEAWVYERLIAGGVHEVVAPVLGPHAHGRVLDVGCGGGGLARRLNAVGVDAAFVQARRAGGVCASAEALPFRDGAFDSVVSSCSIKHWPNAAAGVAECRRVLGPGGVLAVVEMDRDASRADMLAWAAHTRIPRPLHRVYAAFDEHRILPAALTVAELAELLAAPAARLDGLPYAVAVTAPA